MSVKITRRKLEALKKSLEAKSITIPDMAKAINISRITLWRIYHGKQKTLANDVYDRLQTEFLSNYLHIDEFIFDLKNYDIENENDIFAYKKIIIHLQWELGIHERQLKDVTYDRILDQNEIKQLKSKLKRIVKLIGDMK